MPSREDLIAFIGGAPAPNGETPPARVTKRDIARAFGVKGEAKADLKLLIKDLQNEGAIARGRKALQVQGRLPAIVVADVAERDRDGELDRQTGRMERGRPAAAHPDPALARQARSRAGARAGARVLMRVEFDPDARARSRPIPAGWSRSSTSSGRAFFAVFRRAEDGSGRALPVEKRSAGARIFVPAAFAGEAEDGDLVAIEPLREGASRRRPSARVVESSARSSPSAR